MAEDLSTQILIQIRDEIVKTNERLDQTRTDLSERLDRSNERLARVVQEQIRQATAIVELTSGQQRLEQGLGLVVDELRALNGRVDNILTGPLGDKVRDHDDRLVRLEARLDAVEQQVG